VDTNHVIGIIIAVLILFLIVWVVAGSRKRTWYKVYMANNEVKLLSRGLNERWYRTSDRYMRFKDEYGKEVTFPSNAHWVLYWEQVLDGDLSSVREEVNKLNKSAAENKQ
jgi:hypothetical protein